MFQSYMRFSKRRAHRKTLKWADQVVSEGLEEKNGISTLPASRFQRAALKPGR